MLEHPKIDDVVYFFARSDSHDYPDLFKGSVKKIISGTHGEVNMVRVRCTNNHGVDWNAYVELERCFTDVHELLADLKQHVNAETQSVDGCIYDW